MSSWHLWPIRPIVSLTNIPFFEDWKFVVCNVSTGSRWSFCGNQSMCRICILIGECCNGVEPWTCWKVLEVLKHVVMPGRLNVINDWNVWNIWNAPGRSCGWNAFGRSCRMNGCTWRSLCLLYVELDSGLKSSLSSGWNMEFWIWSSVWVPECRI